MSAAAGVQPLNPLDGTCLTDDSEGPFWCSTHGKVHDPDVHRAWVSREEDGWGVVCYAHSLDVTVDTPAHARNLAAKHNREQHPDTPPAPGTSVNLTAAAIDVVLFQDRIHIRRMWAALTGLPETEALAYAYQLVALRDAGQPDTLAHVNPF